MTRSFLVAQLGARMHYAVPRILHQAGMLERFVTDITAAKGWPRFLGMLPKRILPPSARRLTGRLPRDIPAQKITAFTAFGWEYARRQKRCNSISENSSIYLWAGKRFCQLTLQCGFGNAQGIYTFNSAGLELLQEGKRRGLQTVMEQTIAPKRVEWKLLNDERNRFPHWEETSAQDEFIDAFIQREEAEWQVADLIICGSEFVRDGIAHCGGPVEKCAVVPYGVDVKKAEAGSQKPQTSNRPLRVLTVGAVGLRKGAPYVLEAAKQLKGQMEFRMVGGIGVPVQAQATLRKHLELTGAVPRSEIAKQFEWADVFLLPSLCEGSATVTYEALAHGLPVICTPNTGTVVRDGVDGFIVPIRNTADIVGKLEELADNRGVYARMSANAHARAKEFTMAEYGRRLQEALNKLPVPHAN